MAHSTFFAENWGHSVPSTKMRSNFDPAVQDKFFQSMTTSGNLNDR